MAEERSLSDLLWDYGVYAPIGLAVTIVEEFPRLSDKGKERASGQIHVARVIGKLAVRQGKREFDKFFGEPSRPSQARAGGAVPSRQPATAPTSSSSAVRASPSAAASDGSARGGAKRSGAGARGGAGRGKAATKAPQGGVTGVAEAVKPPAATAPRAARAAKAPAATPVPEAHSLAIPGYDTLAASQVVQRLGSLRPNELEAIRRYELATRGRRTILHRIAQLAADR